ncbi:putative ABC transporter CDR4 [Glarea lozoyensis 74030]|uniref:Putative ABC transporter CDR4 n=1 Tax=Glarea lozoyensis (strain ATCC 74030 / MF5533) TaxID=1104152 RepID=H0EEF5_GLAL7|nr:putative ABC transporter CDR4 [Glarea lozoyensis 74030]
MTLQLNDRRLTRSEQARESEVRDLARELTTRSSYSQIDVENVFTPKPNSHLDPSSSNFNARAWTKALLSLQNRDQEKYPQRTSGLAFSDLNVHGYGNPTDYQKSVGNVWLELPRLIGSVYRNNSQRKIEILRGFEGLVEAGEMLVVLGPPGSGCSTLLKTIAGETNGVYVNESSYLNYQARARAPKHIPGGVDAWTYSRHMRDVVIAMFGISHTVNTRVGNDFIRGVSGGERKRVSIAEATLSGAPLQCWDNSTRGLDSANAIEFCKTLRMSADLAGTTSCVAIYQAPQTAYDFFDKVILLYEGHQIYFGHTVDAKRYFEDKGFICPDRQTDGDFLTSMTSPDERIIRPGWESRVPKTALEFAEVWKASDERKLLLAQIDVYKENFTIGGEHLEQFKKSREAQQSKRQRIESPYTLDYRQQIMLCLWRGWKRLKGDPSLTYVQLGGNFVMGVVIGTVFYNLPEKTSSFFNRGSLLFFAVLINAFASALEILTLYAQRGIVEKHSRYALYHPSAEAIASMLTDMPYKTLNAITSNIPLYFLTNLRREPGAFFFFILTSFSITLTMSMLFRTIGSTSRSMAQAMAPTAIILLAIMIYTGNIGIILAFGIFLCAAHILTTEFITEKKSKGEVLVFQREAFSKGLAKEGLDPEIAHDGSSVVRKERTRGLPVMARQTAIFHWENVCYDVKIKDETRRILDHVDGWVKPGTLTALMWLAFPGKA